MRPGDLDLRTAPFCVPNLQFLGFSVLGLGADTDGRTDGRGATVDVPSLWEKAITTILLLPRVQHQWRKSPATLES